MGEEGQKPSLRLDHRAEFSQAAFKLCQLVERHRRISAQVGPNQD